jgi:hypothetical protein
LGNLIAAKCCTRLGDLAPVAAKALAALEAFQFYHSMGRDRVMVVGDAKQVVDAVLLGEPDWSYKVHIIDTIRDSAQRFTQWKISHINQEANQLAHVLARLATRQCMENVWFSEPPTCIQDMLAFEQSVIHH